MGFQFLVLLLVVQPVISVIGPKGPIVDSKVTCDKVGKFIADRENYCFYHVCLKYDEGGFYTQAIRCALRTRVSDYFTTGFDNPCVHNFDSLTGYDCHRKVDVKSGWPPCAGDMVCLNGGSVTYAQNICWCLCVDGYGGHECRDIIGPHEPVDSSGSICQDGKPMADHCKAAGGCLNLGVCHNQCNDFWCDCPDHEHNTYTGKRCEVYNSSDDYRK